MATPTFQWAWREEENLVKSHAAARRLGGNWIAYGDEEVVYTGPVLSGCRLSKDSQHHQQLVGTESAVSSCNALRQLCR